jgi:hypothetical protein
MAQHETVGMRADYYSRDGRDWNGICQRCGHSYFECRGHCTCSSCNAQRQHEVREGLLFDGDLAAGETLDTLQNELEDVARHCD